MSELISGKEALIALANGESVQKSSDSWAGGHWLDISKKEPFNLDCFLSCLNRHGETIKFRLKPRTITINGIEVPAPFEPKEGDDVWSLSSNYDGYVMVHHHVSHKYAMAVWRTESEIKQVVEALRSVFKPQ